MLCMHYVWVAPQAVHEYALMNHDTVGCNQEYVYANTRARVIPICRMFLVLATLVSCWCGGSQGYGTISHGATTSTTLRTCTTCTTVCLHYYVHACCCIMHYVCTVLLPAALHYVCCVLRTLSLLV